MIIRALLKKYRRFRLFWNLIVHPKYHKSVGGTGVHIPLLKRLKYNFLGFTTQEIIYFDLLHNDFHEYISQWERYKLEFVNGRFAEILGEKVMFPRIFGNYVHVPHVYAYIKDKKIFDLDDIGQGIAIDELLRQKKKLIIKPTRSIGGGFCLPSSVCKRKILHCG